MREIIVGMDIQNEYSQYCYYDEASKEAKSVSNTQEETEFLYNDLFYVEEDKTWHFGYEAQELYLMKKGQYFTDILLHLDDLKVIIIEGQEYNYMDLFCILVKLQLEYCFGTEPFAIAQMVVTTKKPDLVLKKAIGKLGSELHLQGEQIALMSKANAVLYFIFQQEASVWGNGAAVLEYDDFGMQVIRLQVKRQTRPMHAIVTQEVWEDMPDITTDNQGEKKDEALLSCVKKEFTGREKNVSGIYLIGKGFEGDWIKNSANSLCRGRRVFVGQNLYAKGACTAAHDGIETNDGNSGVYVIAKGMIHYDLGVKVRYRGKEEIAPIALGEKEWFNVSGSACVFLDQTDRLEIDLIHRSTKEVIREIIEIKGLPKRPPKTTKLEISMRYLDSKHGEITIRDKGFGSMYPSTGKIYRKEFVLS